MAQKPWTVRRPRVAGDDERWRIGRAEWLVDKGLLS
jgi:hypothetical protein